MLTIKGRKLEFEDAHIIFKNFEGRADRYNAEGKRNFNVILNQEEAIALKERGFTIRMLRPRSEEDEPTFAVKINVSFREGSDKNPILGLIKNGEKHLLGANEAKLLDQLELEGIDFSVHTYEWDKENHKFSGYLDEFYATVVESALDRKYGNIPIAGEGVHIGANSPMAALMDEEAPFN